jgi:hypothetical protein
MNELTSHANEPVRAFNESSSQVPIELDLQPGEILLFLKKKKKQKKKKKKKKTLGTKSASPFHLPSIRNKTQKSIPKSSRLTQKSKRKISKSQN